MKQTRLQLLLGTTIFIFLFGIVLYQKVIAREKSFSGTRAWEDVEYQVSLGPRTPGSTAHQQIRTWMTEELEGDGWQVEEQSCLDCTTLPVHNLIAKKGEGKSWIILGAHYDSRILADKDQLLENRTKAVPGGNDGASGVAVLLELSRVLPDNLNKEIWLVFFDVEDNGHIENHDWILGSRVFVQYLLQAEPRLPTAAIIVDMIGDKDLTIYYERKSDPDLKQEIWSLANELGYNQFIPADKHSILDDHVPFLEAGIPAVDIIDIEYPYYHTTEDTADKVSPESLEAVGATLLEWLTK